jgi:hypothetical protein
MTTRYFFASLTRISNLPDTGFTVERLPRAAWDTGDYVVSEVNPHPKGLSAIELTNRRMIEVTDGDLIVGAFGKRRATLEVVALSSSIHKLSQR